MTTKITENGLTLSKEWFENIDEVEIHKENGIIVIAPAGKLARRDAILDWGHDPVESEETDAAVNHDAYIYHS